MKTYISQDTKIYVHFFMKLCLYCGELINKKDNFEKIGRKYVCLLCYDDYFSEEYQKDSDENYYDEEVED